MYYLLGILFTGAAIACAAYFIFRDLGARKRLLAPLAKELDGTIDRLANLRGVFKGRQFTITLRPADEGMRETLLISLQAPTDYTLLATLNASPAGKNIRMGSSYISSGDHFLDNFAVNGISKPRAKVNVRAF